MQLEKETLENNYKLVIDLEMCDTVKPQFKQKAGKLHEIIQIGAVLLDRNNNEVKRFSTYVKPEYSIIRKTITNLTGITYDDVKDAPKLDQALNSLTDIIIEPNKTTLCTWSNSDTKAIEQEMKVKKLKNEVIDSLCRSFFDIQKDFNTKVKIGNRINLAKALELVGLDFEGTAHGALVDAVNTAKLYTAMQDDKHVKEVIKLVEELLTDKPCTSTIGDMFDFSQFNLEE